MRLTETDKIICLRFFNQGGYVLDFTSQELNNFTYSVVNVALCAEYGLSKGKSLEAYVDQAEDSDIIKLFSELLKYYEASPMIEEDKKTNLEKFNQYQSCKNIVLRFENSDIYVATAIQIKNEFSSEYMKAQIDLMLKMKDKNPTEAIGKSKELIESCCKTILEKVGIEFDPKSDMIKLVDKVFDHFKIMPKDIDENIKGVKSIKQILGNLKAIAQGIAELRNSYGSGHGKSDTYKGLEPRHAQLAVGSSITLVNFLWDSYNRNYVTTNKPIK